jgi:hypothetical protein
MKNPLQRFRSDFFDGARVERSDFTAFHQNLTPLNFGRFESKYIVTAAVRARLENAIERHMVLDSYCANMPGTCYDVRSIYFDDPLLSCYHQKIDGLLNRRKFRIRSYGADRTVLFLEEKGRRNAFSYKRRIVIPPALHGAVLAADWRTLIEQMPDDSDVWSRFVSTGIRAHLRPAARVDYVRRAYVNNSGYRFRVTFDGELRAVQSGAIDDRGVRSRAVLAGRTIVEIKFESQIPVWFIRLVESNDLQRVSISKYCACAEALDLVAAAD